MATFVLVHGGGHGGWCWQRVARILRARGHEVYAPTLTGFGERVHLAAAATSFEVFVTDIANLLDFENLRDVVLVGHSMGGVVVPRVAEAAPDRVACAIWLAAVVTADGETLLDAVPQSEWIARAVTVHPGGTLTTDVALLMDAILNDGTDADRAFVAARHREYPHHALVEPGRLSAFLRLGIPSGYVIATQDRTIPPDLARRFAARLPGAVVREVDAGHDAMISRPVETADVLEALAR